MNPIAAASAGLTAGFNRFDQASSNLSNAFQPGSNTDPASAAVDQLTAAARIQASAATVRVSERMLKQLLDITV
jgi:hypothetical protein